ncbi:MAG: hypothetical protein Q8M25_01460, partial [Rhodoferax sp.]|nr:hypothetical protein [Rhodoferax sp.]
VKDNQPKLADSMRDFFAAFLAAPDRTPHQFDAAVEKDHGRLEVRRCLGATKLKDLRKIVFQDNKGCLNCHNSDKTFEKFAPDDEKTPWLKKRRPDIDTLHDWLPNTKAHWNAVRCVECHTPEVKANRLLSHEILDKEKAEKKCLSCHSANSSLKTRLYRHMVKDEQQRLGFTSSIILSNSYVIGATRHPLLDSIVIGMVLLTLGGVLVHGAIRIVCAIRRKGKRKTPGSSRRRRPSGSWKRKAPSPTCFTSTSTAQGPDAGSIYNDEAG